MRWRRVTGRLRKPYIVLDEVSASAPMVRAQACGAALVQDLSAGTAILPTSLRSSTLGVAWSADLG